MTMPRPAALEAIARFSQWPCHPVGAAVGRALTDEWVLILPPGSGIGLQWAWPAAHRQDGVLMVPPRTAGVDEDLRWARLGNRQGRAFTAPLPLYALFPHPEPRPLHSAPAGADRVPVRI
ncbi:hypothetical protein [Streptomyces sp. NPDC054865]